MGINFPLRKILSWLAFIIALILLVPARLINDPDTGIDPSYMYALQWISHHLPSYRYGPDIAYTYGPLGFLAYRLADTWQRITAIILFDLYLYFNFLFIVKRFLPVRSVFSFLILVGTIYFFARQHFPEAAYFLVFLFSAISFINTNKYGYLINATLITILSFFIKVNIGLILLGLLFMVILYQYRRNREQQLFYGLYITAIFVIAWLMSQYLRVDISTYLHNSTEVINGYNEYMVVPIALTGKMVLGALAILVLYSITGLYFAWADRFDSELIIRYALGVIVISILFKYSFSRADTWHMQAFFANIVPVIAILSLFEYGTYRKRLQQLLPVSFLIVLCLYPITNHFKQQRWNDFKALLPTEYINDLCGGIKDKFNYPPSLIEERKLPERIIHKIGNGTVDLMPFNLSLLFINHLQYEPRPTLQSLCAFNGYLDSLNYFKYESNSAPRFILFECFSIDHKLPFGDESITKRAMMQWYSVIDSFQLLDPYNGQTEEYLLMEKNATPKKITLKPVGTGILNFNEKLFLDTTAPPQILYADFHYTLTGKIKRTIFQPTLINMEMGYENGLIDTFRAIVPIMKTGVLINRKVTNTAEAATFFETTGASNEKVKWIKFSGMDDFSFNNSINIRIETLDVKKE